MKKIAQAYFYWSLDYTVKLGFAQRDPSIDCKDGEWCDDRRNNDLEGGKQRVGDKDVARGASPKFWQIMKSIKIEHCLSCGSRDLNPGD